MRDLIKNLGKDHAVILSSHIMGEITAVCDYIIMIANGRIVAEGTLEELEGSKNAATVTVESRGDAASVKAELEKIEGAAYIRVSETGHSVKTVIEAKEGFDLREDIFAAFVRANAPILEMSSSFVGLEDLFIKIASMPAPEEQEENIVRKEKKASSFSPLGKAYLNDENDTENGKTEADDGEDDSYRPLFSNDSDENDNGGDKE